MSEELKKMVKQVITYDDGSETTLEYTSLGEKVQVPAEEEVAEAEQEAEVPAETVEDEVVETEPEAEELQG